MMRCASCEGPLFLTLLQLRFVLVSWHLIAGSSSVCSHATMCQVRCQCSCLALARGEEVGDEVWFGLAGLCTPQTSPLVAGDLPSASKRGSPECVALERVQIVAAKIAKVIQRRWLTTELHSVTVLSLDGAADLWMEAVVQFFSSETCLALPRTLPPPCHGMIGRLRTH